MTLQIQLTDELSTYLQQRAAELGYADVSGYVAAILQAEQRRKSRSEIDQLLLGAADGPFAEWTKQDVEDVRRLGQKLIARQGLP
jgi:predicted transcriptional regulator